MGEAHGSWCWFDLMTLDMGAAQAFYGAVVGWNVAAFRDGYDMWSTAEGQTIGGSMRMPEELASSGVPPHWLGYVQVDDIEASTAQVTELGGSVMHGVTEIDQVGRFSVVADPHGAVLALFQPAEPGPPNEEVAHGRVTWRELYSGDLASTWPFYEGLFGWVKTEAMEMGPMGTYQMYSRPGGPTLGGMMRRPPQTPASCWMFYFHVADLDGAVAQATAHGARVLNGPMEVPGGDRVATLADPQGAVFSLHASAVAA